VVAQAFALGLNYDFEIVQGVDEAWVKAHVESGEFWGGLVVHDTSTSLSAALVSQSTTYDPSSAFTYYYDQARGGATYSFGIGTIGASVGSYVSASLKTTLTKTLQAKALRVSQVNAAVLTNPVSVNTKNLHSVPSMGVSVGVGAAILQLNLVNLIQSLVIMGLFKALDGGGVRKSDLIIAMGFHRVAGSALMAFIPHTCGSGAGLLLLPPTWVWPRPP
jgi:uncharacterized membrane protein YeaQ/YmgE (transglycosylase-associated protein family)